jgi:hypothetical protein
MNTKKLNKEHIVSVRLCDEYLKKNYEFMPEKTYKIPFTNIVWSHTLSAWSEHGRSSYFLISGSELENYIVRDDKLYLKPRVEISMSSGWRDDVVLYFNTKKLVTDWIKDNLGGIVFVDVSQ